MPSKFSWWAGVVGEDSYDLAADCPSREAAIHEALRNADDDEVIQIVEARSSTDRRYEGADFVPFTHTRNHEIIGRKGPQP